MWAFFAFSPPNTEIQTARRVTDVTTEASLDTIRTRRVTDVPRKRLLARFAPAESPT